MARNSKSLKTWEKIFHLSDELHLACDDVHSPEEVKKFHEMTISQIKLIKTVMFFTADEPAGIGLKALAQELGVSPASMSEQVNVLVNKGLLEREQSKNDRRAVCIRLSDYTVKIIEKVNEYLDRKTAEFLKEINPGEAALLDALLDKFIQKIESIKPR